jgi:glycosyltransferase involved in cell wall biosynthesis
MRIRVGINLLGIQRGRSGGAENYVRELLEQMQFDSSLDLILFTNRVSHESFARYTRVQRVLCPVKGSRRTSRVMFEQFLLCAVARKHRCDVLFCPGYLSPLYPRLPTVVSVLDMNFRDIPMAFSRSRLWLQEFVIPRAARRADAVITISEFSRRRILQELGLEPSKVHVTHLAARTFEVTSQPTVDAAPIQMLPERFIISVSGSSPPHKNIERLCKAFRRARESFVAPWELVCVGPKPSMFPSLAEPASENGIHLLGYVEEDELAKIYRRAQGFVLPSLYEGFGLPALEAMYAGLPVCCSNAASLPEVVGDAALLFDPLSESSIADALIRFVNDSALRQRLVVAGRSNLDRFSWRKCAEATAEVFKTVIYSQQKRA